MDARQSPALDSFGRLLRRHRLALGLSQEELAERSGLSVRAIANMEGGRTARPHRHSILSLADALGLLEPERLRFDRASRVAGSDPAVDAAKPPAGHLVPRELPAAVRHFTGRAVELDALSDLAAGGEVPGPVICAIGGTAGVGKTALAIQWAHQSAERFPDGQLYVNLRGFDPALPPMPATEAIRLALDAFQIPAGQIPASAEARAGLYRTVLAGKKVLIVADNAADAGQVRPMLPGSPGCLVIVTSRRHLAGLVATDGAILMNLDVLTEAEAHDLLARILGYARVAAEPEAAGELIEACGRLPLALAITAARATTTPRLPLAALAAELAGAAGRLDALDAGDPLASVRAALDSSYQQLSADAARIFRLLGVHPGPDISAPAAASLAGLRGPHAARHLAELAGASLISQDGAGRYVLHDLVRLYAAEQAQRFDAETELEAATCRMLDHYLHTGHAAARLLRPTRDPITVDAPSPGTAPELLADDRAAMSWFQAEHQVLIAAAGHAAAAGKDARAWTIAWTLVDYFSFRGHWHDHLAVETAALAAAVRLGDLARQAKSHYYLAEQASRLGRYDDADSGFRRALDLFGQLDDLAWRARAYVGLSLVFSRQGQHDQAVGHARQGLELFTTAGHELGQANALNAIGWYLTQLGDHEQALAHCQLALALCRKAGGRQIEAETLDSLAHAHHHLGQHAEALACYHQSLDIAWELGHRRQQSATLTSIGDTYQATGDHAAARTAWHEALAILDDLHHPDAADVRTKLDAAGAGHTSAAAAGGY